MATKKKVMVDDSVKVVKPVHQPKLREDREDDDRVLPRYTVEIVKKYDNTPLQKGWYCFYY